MAYMSHLGIWGLGTPFREFSDFIQAVEKRYYIKCGFPLAEERKKRKTFFSHAAGSLGTGVQGGFRSRGSCRFQFLFCHPPLPDMPHPPTHKVLVEGVS